MNSLSKKKNQNAKTKTGFFAKLSNWFSSSENNSQENISSLTKHWAAITHLLARLKILKINLQQQPFWKGLNLNWETDINNEGHIRTELLEKLDTNKIESTKIISQLSKKTLIFLIDQELQKHCSLIFPFLQDVLIFTPLNDLSFWSSTGLNWQQDITREGQFTSSTKQHLVENKNLDHFKAILKLTPAFLSNFILEVVIQHWKLIEKNFYATALVLNEKTFSLYQAFSLNAKHFNEQSQLKKELIASLITKRAFNLQIIKNVNVKSLHDLILKKLLTNWKTNLLSVFAKIKNLNFSFDLDQTWNQTGLRMTNDFDATGNFSKQGLIKISQYQIPSLLFIMEKLNYAFFVKFLERQILDYWKELQPYLEKLVVVKSAFFSSQWWTNLGLDLTKDLDQSFFLQQPIIDQLPHWELKRLKNIFVIDIALLSKFIIQVVNTTWQKKRLILAKILVFNKEKLLASKEWKATNLQLDVDLQKDCNFYLSALQNLPNLSVQELLGITKLTVPILIKMLLQCFDEHWSTFASILATVKKKKLNFSGQSFWFLTNLNWNTDLTIDGFLTTESRGNIPNITLDQIIAIKNISTEKIQVILDSTLEVIAEQKTKVKTAPKMSFWQKLKLFFGLTVFLFKPLQERLEERINLNQFDLQQKLSDQKTYRQRLLVLKKLRKQHSIKIIERGDIVALGEANIQPNRFVIEMMNVSKYFPTPNGVNEVISKISVKIKKGDFVVILGPSGAGKSTLLNLISGITNPDGGDLFVNGINLTLLDDGSLTEFRRRHVSFIFQQYNLLQNLTAKENIDIVAALLPKDRQSLDMEELLKLLGIHTLVNKYPFQLSGGEQQRFAIARALSKNPQILFCDEPTGALDQEMSKKVMQLLFEINRLYRTTIVLVTHNRLFAQIAKTVIHFVNGKVVRIQENEKQVEPKNISFYY